MGSDFTKLNKLINAFFIGWSWSLSNQYDEAVFMDFTLKVLNPLDEEVQRQLEQGVELSEIDQLFNTIKMKYKCFSTRFDNANKKRIR